MQEGLIISSSVFLVEILTDLLLFFQNNCPIWNRELNKHVCPPSLYPVFVARFSFKDAIILSSKKPKNNKK